MGAAQSEIGGYRVCMVHEGSPAHTAGLEMFFDLIIEVEGRQMTQHTALHEVIKQRENLQTKLVVFNLRTQEVRDVHLTPRSWQGAGILGARVVFDWVEPTEQQGVRILEVTRDSPAENAGLEPYTDWIIGTQERPIKVHH